VQSTRVTAVGILGQSTLCELEVLLWNDLVQGVVASVDDLAGIAVAEEYRDIWLAYSL
jgi:hypothetical protein